MLTRRRFLASGAAVAALCLPATDGLIGRPGSAAVVEWEFRRLSDVVRETVDRQARAILDSIEESMQRAVDMSAASLTLAWGA